MGVTRLKFPILKSKSFPRFEYFFDYIKCAVMSYSERPGYDFISGVAERIAGGDA